MNPTPVLRVRAKVVHIPDGDTMRVQVKMDIDVRLLGGGTEEIRDKDPTKRKLALEAKRQLYTLCYEQTQAGEWAEGKEGILEIPITSDNISHLFTFGRVLGNFWVDGVDCMDKQLESGLAKPRGGK